MKTIKSTIEERKKIAKKMKDARKKTGTVLQKTERRYPVEVIRKKGDSIDPVFLKKPYKEMKTVAEFKKYFAGHYNGTIVPTFKEWRCFINTEKHPVLIKGEEAVREKRILILSNDDSESILARLHKENLSEDDMSVDTLKEFIKETKQNKKVVKDLKDIAKKSGVGQEVYASLVGSGMTMEDITEEQLNELIKNIKKNKGGE